MKRINKHRRLLVGLATLFFLLCGFTVHAAGSMAVVETYTGETEIALYLRGVEGDISDVSVQVGTAVCDSMSESRLSETGQPVKTLFMLDNSLSIQKADRKRIAEILQNIISNQMENEEMAIATFSEGVAYLADYTADTAKLLDTVAGISYQSSHTYLTDVLYDLLSTEYVPKKEDVFHRIIVISDGMDNKSIGYTKDEFYALLKECPVPIYTIGAQTKKKDNNEQLENMFAISRMTGADSFLLGDIEDLQDISQAFNEDRNIVKLTVRPSGELLDGSKKTLKLTFASGESLSTEVVMPQQAKTADLETEAKEPKETGKPGEAKGGASASVGTPVLLLVGLLLLAAAAIAVIIIVVKKKKEAKPIADEDLSQLDKNLTEDAKTELMEETALLEDGETVFMWNAETSYNIILTDVNAPDKTFQASLTSSVVIGRKQGVCGIAIDYDKSVSGRHCEIWVRDGKFYVEDLQSLNGTYVDGRRVLSEVEIVSGDVLRIGKLELKFEMR